jgi:hypothetical protein
MDDETHVRRTAEASRVLRAQFNITPVMSRSIPTAATDAGRRVGRDRRFPGSIRAKAGNCSWTLADSFLIRGESHPSATSGWPTNRPGIFRTDASLNALRRGTRSTTDLGYDSLSNSGEAGSWCQRQALARIREGSWREFCC